MAEAIGAFLGLALYLFLAWFLFWKVPRAFFIGRKEGKERDASSGQSVAYRLGRRLRRSRRNPET